MLLKIGHYLKTRGLLWVLRHSLGRLAGWFDRVIVSWLWDLKWGVRTGGWLSPAKLGLNEEGVEYRGSRVLLFHRAIRQFQIDMRDRTFIDYGCGMGRVLLLAASYPCKRVIGVEFNAQLAQIARNNAQIAARKLKCQTVTIIQGDACDYAIPEEADLLFFYNPFTGNTLRSVFQTIESSLRHSPRRIQVIYHKPVFLETMSAEFPWLVEMDRFNDGEGGWAWVLYQNREFLS